MKLVVRIVSFILMFYSLQSSANNRNQFDYFGFTASLPSYDLDFTPSTTAEELSPLKEQVGSEKVGARLFYGYQFNRYLAAEAGVNYNGKNSFSLYSENTNEQDVVVKTTVHSGSFTSYGGDVRIVGTYPITNNFYLKASLGALAWSSELDTVTKENVTIFAVDTSDS